MNRTIVAVAAGLVLLLGTWTAAQESAPVSKGQKFFDAGVELMEKGDFDAAIESLQKAIEADPQLAPAFYALAVAEARKKAPDTAAARKRHQQAISLGYQHNEWLENYCSELDKKGI